MSATIKSLIFGQGLPTEIAKAVFDELKDNGGKENVRTVFLMMDSGARGNKQQVRQLCGTRVDG